MSNTPNTYIPEYTIAEEIAHSISHGIGTVLSIVGLVVLIVFAVSYGDAWHIVSFSIFGSTLIILYLASTLYHSLPMPRVKRILKRFDHAAIFLLIAGTYTPFMLVSLRGPWGWSIFGVIWGLAVLGILLKIFFPIAKFESISVVLYVFMGWLCLIVSKQLFTHLPRLSLILLVLGGVSYTVGVIFYIWEKLPYNHAVWHLFVLSGSIFHYFSVLCTL